MASKSRATTISMDKKQEAKNPSEGIVDEFNNFMATRAAIELELEFESGPGGPSPFNPAAATGLELWSELDRAVKRQDEKSTEREETM
jgi:hypothetical protein